MTRFQPSLPGHSWSTPFAIQTQDPRAPRPLRHLNPPRRSSTLGIGRGGQRIWSPKHAWTHVNLCWIWAAFEFHLAASSLWSLTLTEAKLRRRKSLTFLPSSSLTSPPLEKKYKFMWTLLLGIQLEFSPFLLSLPTTTLWGTFLWRKVQVCLVAEKV